MSWKIKILKSDGIISSECSGAMNYDQIIKKASESIHTGKKHGITKHLVDNRNLKPDLSVVNIYCLPKVLIDQGLNPGSKIAVIFSSKVIKNDNAHFLETVSINQGFNLQLFTNKGQALEWLKK